MMKQFLPRYSLIAVYMGSVMFAAACGSPKVSFYLLSPFEEGKTSQSRKSATTDPLAVGIGVIRLPQYLERPQIVTRDGSHEMRLDEYHQWAGNLRKNVSRTLSKNLSILLNTPRVFMAPNIPAGVHVRLDMEVLKFERDADQHMRLVARWNLSSGVSRTPFMTRLSSLQGERVPSETGYENTVASMSRLLGELSKEIATEITKASQLGAD